MKLVIAAILAVVFVFLAAQAWRFYGRGKTEQARVEDLEIQLAKVQGEQGNLRADLEYFSREENIEKELRARFNYRKPDEKMIIIVPAKTSSPPVLQP